VFWLSPSTLTVAIAALIGAAEMGRARHLPELAGFLEEQADWLESHLEGLDGDQRRRAWCRGSSSTTCASGRRRPAAPSPACI